MKHFKWIFHWLKGCDPTDKVWTGEIEVQEKKNNEGFGLKGSWDVYGCKDCEDSTAIRNFDKV